MIGYAIAFAVIVLFTVAGLAFESWKHDREKRLGASIGKGKVKT